MLSYLKDILRATTGKSSLQDVSVEHLQQLADKHPYFGAAQLLLAKKLCSINNNAEDVLQKTALHFDNSLWLNFVLFDEADDEISEVPVIENSNEQTNTDINQVSSIQTNSTEIIEVSNEVNDSSSAEDEADDVSPGTSFETNEKLSNLLKQHAEAFEKPAQETTLPIENIPHHRIDYFESQGIKLDLEKDANDKLGTQLKRFTDWLKQMKRVNPNLTNLETDIAGEIQAQNMAARSNDSKEIVTEAMADVLIKQGKPQEAVAIYEKLSFSNPSKSAYFAAKIKELKPE